MIICIPGMFFRRIMKKVIYLVLSQVLLLIAGVSFVEASEPAMNQQNIRVVADSIECDQTANFCKASGNAEIEKTDDPDKKSINADVVKMFFERESAGAGEGKAENLSGERKPKKFLAQGHVKITIKNAVIRGDKASYDPDTEIAEVYGKVTMTSGKNVIMGNYGRANLKTGEYKVLNTGKRVTALIFKK